MTLAALPFMVFAQMMQSAQSFGGAHKVGAGITMAALLLCMAGGGYTYSAGYGCLQSGREDIFTPTATAVPGM